MRTKRLIVFVAILFLFCLLAGCNHHVIPGANNEGESAISQILELRSECEQRTRMLKTYYGPETLEYKKAWELYIEAKKKVDAWTGALIFDLTAGSKLSTSCESKIDSAAKATVEFRNYVNQVFEHEPVKKHVKIEEMSKMEGMSKISMSIDIRDVIESFTNAGKKIWIWYQEGEEKKRAKIIEALEDVKWQYFEDI
ncbi:hypothetical protein KAU32_02355 [bacterium]|nr:hypothetical protein [bacterium]